MTELSTGQDLEPFLDLPEALYRGDPNWVPPLRRAIARQLSPENPFRSYGILQPFLARRDGVVVGRVVAAVNRRLMEKEGRPVGLFGYFESLDDQEVADALLAAAGQWLQEQGCLLGRGPINLSTHVGCLLLTEGFDSPPYLMMPYNPPYYPRLVEAAGWQPAKAAYAYDFPMPELARTFERGYQRALAAGIRFRPVRLKGRGFEEDCRAIYRVFSESFTDNWSATPRGEAEFLEEAQDLRRIAEPRLFPVAEHNGQMVGFWMGLPDYNLAFRHVAGRLNALGLLKFLWYRRRIDRLRVVALGVLPAYQSRHWGIGPALIHLGRLGAVDERRPYGRAELSWVWADNMKSRKLIEAAGGTRYKTYTVYEKALAG